MSIISSWKKLLFNLVHNVAGFTSDEAHHSAVENDARLACIIRDEGFFNMTEEDANGHNNCHSEPLTDEDS